MVWFSLGTNVVIMVPKRLQSYNGKASRKAISLTTKQRIIKDFNHGLSVKLICEKYNMARTTVNTIIKNKEMLEKMIVTDSSTRFFKGREAIVEMERLLEIWIREKQMRGDSLTQNIICAKAKNIFNELPSSSNTRFTEFTASHGWLKRFKKRSGIDTPMKIDTETVQDQNNINEEQEKTNITISTSHIKIFLKCWETIKKIATFHPHVEKTKLNICSFEHKIVNYFQNLLNERENHNSTLNSTKEIIVTPEIASLEDEGKFIACAVNCCYNHILLNTNKTFFKLPSNSDNNNRRHLWLNAIQAKHKENYCNDTFVCSDHFLLKSPSNDPAHIDYIPTLNLTSDAKQSQTAPMKNFVIPSIKQELSDIIEDYPIDIKIENLMEIQKFEDNTS